MPFILFALFLCVPLIEIGLFIQVGGAIGLWSTLAVVVITAILGTALVQRQGLSTFQRGQKDMQEGRVPMSAMRDGAFIFMAGALLLTPGFLTDAVGFLLLIPPVRKWLARKIMSRVMKSSNIHVNVSGFDSGPDKGPNPGNPSDKGPTIEGDYSRVDDSEKPSGSPQHQGDSPWRQ